jgi:ribosome-binding protein aMBF1 (putative translation factor)
MPYREYEEDDHEQQWDTVKIGKSIKTDPTIIPNKILDNESRIQIINKREELKLSQIALNMKCRFPYKYTIRDIESGKTTVSLTELKTINTILELNIK